MEDRPRLSPGFCGEAAFLPVQGCLWDMRCAMDDALRHGQAASRYMITDKMEYYPHVLDKMLRMNQESPCLAEKLGERIQGQVQGALRCTLLWDVGYREGILVHYDGQRLLGAYLS